MTVTSKWVALHEVSDYLAKGWREVQIKRGRIGCVDKAALMVSPEEPASKPAKVECPNCGGEAAYFDEHHDGYEFRCAPCKPAQPEPVAEEMPEAVSVNTWQLEELLKYADLAEVSLRTGFHPPEFLFEPADRSLRQCIDAIKEQRDQWRTHSAQPAKVRMTKELRRALDAAEAQAGWHMDQGRPKTFDEIDAAIAAVRAQAAEAGKVRLPKVRSYFLSLSMLPEYRNDEGRAFLAEVKAELDAAEGGK